MSHKPALLLEPHELTFENVKLGHVRCECWSWMVPTRDNLLWDQPHPCLVNFWDIAAGDADSVMSRVL